MQIRQADSLLHSERIVSSCVKFTAWRNFLSLVDLYSYWISLW